MGNYGDVSICQKLEATIKKDNLLFLGDCLQILLWESHLPPLCDEFILHLFFPVVNPF